MIYGRVCIPPINDYPTLETADVLEAVAWAKDMCRKGGKQVSLEQEIDGKVRCRHFVQTGYRLDDTGWWAD